MSPTARIPPSDPKLQNAYLLTSVSLRKSWTKSPSYWVELYGKKGPNAKFTQFYIYRQWSFFKGSMFNSDRELVEGYTLSNSFTNLAIAGDALVLSVSKQVDEKGYRICAVEEPDPNPNGTDPIYADGETRKKIFSRLFAIEKMIDESVQKNETNETADKQQDFWATARQREKKAKW